MKQYSRYTDINNRLYILIRRYCDIKNGVPIPTRVIILDVAAEKEFEYTYAEFENILKLKKVTRII
jgi:hypothetical protein